MTASDPKRTLQGHHDADLCRGLHDELQMEGLAMATDPPDDLTEEERALFGARDVAYDLALRCRQIREMNVSVSASVLDDLVNFLMTEFWDQCFSQTEIRNAFTRALADMNRYAAGQERR